MKRLSSSLTIWWYKRLGPLLLAAALILTATVLAVLVIRGTVATAWLLAPVALALLVFAYLQWFIFPLADEVFDDGDYLVIRRGTRTERLALRDVTSVTYSLVFDPPRIVLQTSANSPVTFMPYVTAAMCFFRPHPLVATLKARIAGVPAS